MPDTQKSQHEEFKGYAPYIAARILYQIRGVLDGATSLTITLLTVAKVVPTIVASSPLAVYVFPFIKICMLFPFLGGVIRMAYLQEKESDDLKNEKYFWRRYPETTKLSILLGALGGGFIVAILVGLFVSAYVGFALTLGVIIFDSALEIIGMKARHAEINELKAANEKIKKAIEVLSPMEQEAFQALIDTGQLPSEIKLGEKQCNELSRQIKLYQANQNIIESDYDYLKCQSFYLAASNGIAFIGIVLVIIALAITAAFPLAAVALTITALSILTLSSVLGVVHAFIKRRVDINANDVHVRQQKLIAENISEDTKNIDSKFKPTVPSQDTQGKDCLTKMPTQNKSPDIPSLKSTDRLHLFHTPTLTPVAPEEDPLAEKQYEVHNIDPAIKVGH